LSPASMDSDDISPGATERPPVGNPFDKLRTVVTNLPRSPKREEEREGTDDEEDQAMCASPTSEGSTPISQMTETARFEH
jgi:hypothetical protein